MWLWLDEHKVLPTPTPTPTPIAPRTSRVIHALGTLTLVRLRRLRLLALSRAWLLAGYIEIREISHVTQ